MEEEVGEVFTYFSRIGVAGIRLKGTLRVGERIHIKGSSTDFVQTVDSMQIDRKSVESAGPGAEVGIKTAERVRKGDVVYRVVEE